MLRKRHCVVMILFMWMVTWTTGVNAGVFDQLSKKVTDNETIHWLKEVWDAQTFQQLKNGVLVMPDQAVNDILAQNVASFPALRQITFHAQGDNYFEVHIVPAEGSAVVLGARFIDVHHNSQSSLFYCHVEKKELVGHPVMSWFFNRLSLGLLSKLFGSLQPDDGLQLELDGNDVKIDFHDFLYRSPPGRLQLFGSYVPDLVEIQSVRGCQGYTELHVQLHLSDVALNILEQVL